jgi:hypothetical protein
MEGAAGRAEPHEPSAQATWPEAGTGVQIDSELIISLLRYVWTMGATPSPKVRQVESRTEAVTRRVTG